MSGELTRLAGDDVSAELGVRLRIIAGRVAAPVRVAVTGCPGVGVQTVTAALAREGIAVTEGNGGYDIAVRVVAEVLRPEDCAALATPAPRVVLYNKADLEGFGGAGPMAAALRRCRQITASTGMPAEPFIALLAVAAVDTAVIAGDLLNAVQTLVEQPADLRSPDAFLVCSHGLSHGDRLRLLECLDLVGIAHTVVEMRENPGVDPRRLRAVFRRLSNLDGVIGRIAAAAAEVHYRRMRTAVLELEALAVSEGVVAGLVNSEEIVTVRAAAAAAALRGVGISADDHPGGDAALARAVRWRRLADGPLTELYRSCAADMVRGSLRVLARETVAR